MEGVLLKVYNHRDTRGEMTRLEVADRREMPLSEILSTLFEASGKIDGTLALKKVLQLEKNIEAARGRANLAFQVSERQRNRLDDVITALRLADKEKNKGR